MGIDIYCSNRKCKFQGKQCFVYRSMLLDALRAYLKENQETHQLELKLVNWFYRYDEDDEDRVIEMSQDEKTKAQELLQEKKLYGLFCWTFLEEGDYIGPQTARSFLETYSIVKKFMKENCMDVSILTHAAHNNHGLRCC